MLLINQLNLVSKVWKPLVMSVRWKYPKAFQDLIKTQPEVKCDQLPNGLTVVSQERSTYHVSVGIFIDAGSRYESSTENGTAHFFDHLVFKSTVARDSKTLERSLACTAARFNSFTEREMCGYYAECFPEDVTLVVDILSDCVFRNRLDEGEIQLQKQIVFREMEQQDSDMNTVLFDYLHGAAYFGTSLAQTVLGPTNNLACFNPATLSYYLNKLFLPSRTVLVAVGNISHCKLLQLANCYLSGISPSICFDEEYRFTGGDFRFRDDALPYCNSAFAWEAPGVGMDSGGFALEVAGALVGAWDRSQPGGQLLASPLAQAAHSGFSDGFKSFYIRYKGGGLWGCQAYTKRQTTDDWVSAYAYEIMRMCTMVSEPELERAKNALKMSMLTRYENATKFCIDLGRWSLYIGCQPTLAQCIDEVEAVTVEKLNHYMNHYIYDMCPALAAVGSCEQLLNYTTLRTRFYWLRN